MAKPIVAIFFIILFTIALIPAVFIFFQQFAVDYSALANSVVISPPVSKIAGEKVQNKTQFAAPDIIKSIYLTGWSAGSSAKINYAIELAKESEINSVVIDIKDFSGYVSYNALLPDVEKYKSKQIKIPDIDQLTQKLHDSGIYIIARITVFQDPALAKARPDLAVHSNSAMVSSGDFSSDNALWQDRKGLSWIDPSAKEAWAYNAAIAKDAFSHGFDEVNFDYVRFPSDGNLKDMAFPFSNLKNEQMRSVIKRFFQYMSDELAGKKISVDLFGLTTVSDNDLGIGQVLEDAFPYFNYICPMVYPSHYASGSFGYKNPAAYPYEVVSESMKGAVLRLENFRKSEKPETKNLSRNVSIRPWLQDFRLGATYDATMVRSEINAVYDALGTKDFNGFMLWNPSNIYTKGALEVEK